MTSNVAVFNYENNQVRNVVIKGEPWFVLADICKVLDIANARNVSQRLDEDEKGVRQIDTLGGKQKLTVINESGLYAVILRSDKPQAKPFRKWVTSEVLPSIRKTGSYQTKQADELRQKNVQIREQNAKNSASVDDIKARNLAVKEMNARSRQAQTLVRLAHLTQNATCREAMIAQAANTVSGKALLPLPSLAAKTYNAEEIGERLGISKQRVGRLTNLHNLKTAEYGGWFADFVQGVGEKQTFRYYENVIPVLKSLLETEVAV